MTEHRTIDLGVVQAFIARGYELKVRLRDFAGERCYHASVVRRGVGDGHNFAAPSVKEALEGLETYLGTVPK